METAARWSLFWSLFIGVGALVGTGMMWVSPKSFGMLPLLELMHERLPFADLLFSNFFWPGLFLLCIIGVPNLAGAYLVIDRLRIAPSWLIACGLVLVAWTCLQVVVVFGPNPISILYMVFGVLQAITAILWHRSNRHSR